jgi:hypothetical protein
MPRWQRVYLIATCALIAGAFAYAASDWGMWPHLTYLPLTGGFTLHPPPGALAMTYIGSIAWGVGGAAVGAIVGAALCAIRNRPWPDRVLRLFGAWAITAILLAGLFETWNLWPW